MTRFPNNAPEPPGNSANTVYMITMSHFLDAPTARTRAHRTAERTVTRKLAAQGGREGRDSGRGGREGKDSD